MGEKKRLWITRRLSDKTLERAQQYYDCEINFEDRVYSQDELIGRSAQFDAILPCHSEIFHGDVVEKLDPRVRIIANHSVGVPILGCSHFGYSCQSTACSLVR